MEAARHALEGNASGQFEDLTKFGITPEQLHDLQLSPQAANHDVWPEHWRAVTVFCGMFTQWRTVVGSKLIWLGLDYTALDAVEARIEHHPDVPKPSPAELFAQIRTLERAAKPILNKGR